MPDPPLTDLGVAQCRTLRDTFPHDKIDLVTASPLRRTIYTALESFEPVFRARPDTRLILIPDAQETSDVPCDTGTSPADLQREMEEKGLPVDVGLVEEGWNVKVFLLSLFSTATKVVVSYTTVVPTIAILPVVPC